MSPSIIFSFALSIFFFFIYLWNGLQEVERAVQVLEGLIGVPDPVRVFFSFLIKLINYSRIIVIVPF